jgi:hypothetical protein
MCLLLGQATSFIAVHLYYIKHAGAIEDGAATPSTKDLWGLMGVLEAAFIVFFAIFLFVINKKYVGTFFSTMTAKQFRIKSFYEAKTDQMKMNIFKLHPSYYERIRPQVAEWLRDNWDILNEERPDWFTERLKARVPKDMVPRREEVPD